MKRILLAACLAPMITACAGVSPIGTGGIKDIQNAAASICRFVPTAQTVADILLSGNAAVSTTLSIATAICNAVTTNPLADGPGPKNYKPTAYGVQIKGSFIK